MKMTNSFVIMPGDCNHNQPMVFGGKMQSEIDLTSYILVRNVLYHLESDCDDAVTYIFQGKFLAEAQMGDIVTLESEVISVGKKTIVVETTAFAQKKGVRDRKMVCRAKYVFATKKNGQFCFHGITNYPKSIVSDSI